MDEERSTVSEGLDRTEMSRPDLGEETHVGFVQSDETLPDLKVHTHHFRDRQPVLDLRQDEYTVSEAAQVAGTSVEVIMHAVWSGALKAERSGSQVVAIARHDLLEWLSAAGVEDAGSK